jgi:hypothetical protein
VAIPAIALTLALAACGRPAATPSTPPPTVAPTAPPGPTVTASPTPRPTRTATPAPTSLAGQTIPFTIDVQHPLEQTVPEGSSIELLPDGGIRAHSVRASDGSIYLAWTFDPARLPSGASVANVETLVCGSGSGDFYEVYGPYGAEEIEFEVTPPRPDGCWHFTKDTGTDYRVEIYVNDDSVMTIDRIEYRITFR